MALILALWEPTARWVLAGIYAIGLIGIGLVLHERSLLPRALGWEANLALAGYILTTTLLAGALAHGQRWRAALLLPARAWPQAWFALAQTLLAMAVVGLSLLTVFRFETLAERLARPGAVLSLVPAGVILAAGSLPRHQHFLRNGTLALGATFAALVGPAYLGPGDAVINIYRSIWFMLAMALVTIAYGIGLVRILPASSPWVPLARRWGPALGLLASFWILVILAQEAILYDSATRRAPVAMPAVILVLLAMIALMASAIAFAVVPGRDPFGLSDRGRKLYVYVAEMLLFLLMVHIWLTIPELFGLKLVQYWTLIVMAIAFIGVGLSEWFQRRGLPVLAEPLERTGVFLPLLPIVTFWVRPQTPLYERAVERFPGARPFLDSLYRIEPEYGKYAMVWFLLSLLYGLMAASKRSLRFALVAALAANFGIWVLLFEHNLDFLKHPQMWLIPLALIALVTEHLNRDRLGEGQSNALRYAALLVIYVSSTADMFLAGLGGSIIWPMVLAGLSVLGVFAGILLRVRAFLYLGVTFLFLVIFTMIWNAAVAERHIWVWWASGIVLGAAIIGLFALFEKRRNEVLRVLEQLRKWD